MCGMAGLFIVSWIVIYFLPSLPIIAVTAIVGLALVVVFRYTALGLRMQAVVESPRMAELSGVNSTRISTGAWMLTSFIAGLAGVLLPQITGGQVVVALAANDHAC